MIKVNFDNLRRQKALTEQRDISLRTVATETGLALGTVRRLSSGKVDRVYLSTLDTLKDYFKLTEPNQLISFVEDPAVEALKSN